MRTLIVLMAVMLLSGCQLPDAPVTQNSATVETAAADPQAAPSPEPSAAVPPDPNAKPLLSKWLRDDGIYGANFSSLVNLTASPGIETNQRAPFTKNTMGMCRITVAFSGTESAGTLILSQATSFSGSDFVTIKECKPFEGTYDYAAMSGNILRLCKGGVCQYWK